MWDKQNGPIVRQAYKLSSSSINPFQLGEVGWYFDGTNIIRVNADGSTKTESAGSAGATTPARLATAAALAAYTYDATAKTITANANGVWLIDGKTLTVGDRILKVTAGGATDDGLYVVTVKGTASVKTVLTRAGDMSTSANLVPGLLVPVGDGNTLAGNLYELKTTGTITLDTTILEFGEDGFGGSVIPSARMAFSVNPTDGDVICTIGGKTFTAKTTLVAATTTTQVKILGSAALTLAALLDAINGVTNVNVVLDTTPFAAAIVADAVTATVLRIRKAVAQGGNPVAGTVGSTVLAAAVSGGASAWNVANLNAMGRVPQVTITAAMVTAGSADIELDFAPGSLVWQDAASTGVQRAANEAVTKSGNTIHVVLAGGASPNFQATDVFSFVAGAAS